MTLGEMTVTARLIVMSFLRPMDRSVSYGVNAVKLARLAREGDGTKNPF